MSVSSAMRSHLQLRSTSIRSLTSTLSTNIRPLPTILQNQHREQSTTSQSASQSNISHLLTTHPTLSSLLPPAGAWHLTPTSLERTFTFRTFRHAWSFMTLISAYASKSRHHPEWSNIYNRVFVRWTTHDTSGLSKKDVEAAKAVDEFAVKIVGEDGKGKGDVTNDGGDVRGLVEEVRPKGAGGQGGAAGEEAKKQQEKKEIEREEGDEVKEGSLAGVGGQPTFAALSF